MACGYDRGATGANQVDEKNYFGMIEWESTKEFSESSPTRKQQRWQQRGSSPCQKTVAPNREMLVGPRVQLGSENGDSRIPSASLGEQVSTRKERLPTFSFGGLEELTSAGDPRHTLQECEGLADFWYLDDGGNLWHPLLVLPYLKAVDAADAKIGAERNRLKTEVI